MVAKDIRAPLAQGGFRLRKWTSNSPKVLATLVDRDASAIGAPPLRLGDIPESARGTIWYNY